jgi:hypothetical protein
VFLQKWDTPRISSSAIGAEAKRLQQSGDNALKTKVVETLHFYREKP